MLGWYLDNQNQVHSFLDSSGNLSSINYPGVAYTYARGLNNTSQVTGYYLAPGAIFGFVYSGNSYTSFGYPGAITTNGLGINNNGQIVGSYLLNNQSEAQGLLNMGGQLSTVSYPGARNTLLTGINDLGQIVGFASPVGVGPQFGFLYTGGNFTSIFYAGTGTTQYTLAEGINDKGQIVGYYDDDTGVHSFLYEAGVFASIDYPGAEGTIAQGINDKGQIVGYYCDNTGCWHGFVATPVPESDTLILLGTAVVLVGGAVMRQALCAVDPWAETTSTVTKYHSMKLR